MRAERLLERTGKLGKSQIAWFLLAFLIKLLVTVVTGRAVGQPHRAREIMLKARDEDLDVLRKRDA